MANISTVDLGALKLIRELDATLTVANGEPGNEKEILDVELLEVSEQELVLNSKNY